MLLIGVLQMIHSKFPHLWITLLIVLWAVIPRTGLSQTYQLSEDVDHFIGILDAHRSNMDAWDFGDVLIRVRSVGQGSMVTEDGKAIAKGPDAMSVGTEETKLVRLTFDFPGERYRVMTRWESEVLFFDDRDELAMTPERNRSERACVFDKAAGIRLGKLGPGKLSQVSEKADFEYLASYFGIPNFMCLGVSVGTLQFTWKKARLDGLLDAVWTKDNIEKVVHVGPDRYRVVAYGLGRKARFEIDWDTARNVPVKYARYSIFEETSSEKLLDVETIEWQELHGLYVPSAMRGKTSHMRRFEGREFVVENEYEMNFHWFSLNQEHDQDVFAERQMHDVAALDELISEKPFDESPK
jgi:hypothetical protein